MAQDSAPAKMKTWGEIQSALMHRDSALVLEGLQNRHKYVNPFIKADLTRRLAEALREGMPKGWMLIAVDDKRVEDVAAKDMWLVVALSGRVNGGIHFADYRQKRLALCAPEAWLMVQDVASKLSEEAIHSMRGRKWDREKPDISQIRLLRDAGLSVSPDCGMPLPPVESMSEERIKLWWRMHCDGLALLDAKMSNRRAAEDRWRASIDQLTELIDKEGGPSNASAEVAALRAKLSIPKPQRTPRARPLITSPSGRSQADRSIRPSRSAIMSNADAAAVQARAQPEAHSDDEEDCEDSQDDGGPHGGASSAMEVDEAPAAAAPSIAASSRRGPATAARRGNVNMTFAEQIALLDQCSANMWAAHVGRSGASSVGGVGASGGSSSALSAQPAEEAFTVTYGDRAENHTGMQMIGEKAAKGLSVEQLDELKVQLDSKGTPCAVFDLRKLAPSLEPPEAAVLVIYGGINALAGNPQAAVNMLDELRRMPKDTTMFDRGQVKNRHSCHNNTIGDFDQAPDIANKKGTVVNFKDYPTTSQLRDVLNEMLGHASLVAELNHYYDASTCGIGWHGDSERMLVAGARLGPGADGLPLRYQWFKDSQPVGAEGRVELKAGDIYIASQKAVGTDWKHRNEPTLRHAAGKDSCTYVRSKRRAGEDGPQPVYFTRP